MRRFMRRRAGMTTTTKIAGEAMTDAQWLLDVMGRHDFTMPQEAFDAILSELKDARAPLASKPAVPEGFAVKRIEGHGWIVDPPSGSRWIAFQGTPAGELMDALSTAPAQSCGEDEQAGEAVDTFLAEVRAELMRARAKFPGDRIMTIALAEEFGELCKAVLDECSANVRKEAVQTAVMCARVVLDGDGSVNDWRAGKGLDPLTAKPGECRACKGRGSFVNRDLENEWTEPCNGCNGSGYVIDAALSQKAGEQG
jgi:hypothetical protein